MFPLKAKQKNNKKRGRESGLPENNTTEEGETLTIQFGPQKLPTSPSFFLKKKNSKLPLPFLSTSSIPSSLLPPSSALPHLLPLPQHPPSSAPPPSPPLSFPSPPPSPATLFFDAIPVSSSFPAPVPRSIKQDRTRASVQPNRIEGLRSVLFDRTKTILFSLIDQTEWKVSVRPCLGRTNRAKRRPFVWPNRIERRPFILFCLVERCRRKEGRRGSKRVGAGEWRGDGDQMVPDAEE